MASSSISSSKKKASSWFPVRPADALRTEYDTVVRAAHLRHVLVETEGTADLAMRTYLRGGLVGDDDDSGGDPFGALAMDLSADASSRDGGGRIGWVDNPLYSPAAPSSDFSSGADDDASADLPIPPDAIADVFSRRPKGGDVLKVHSAETGMWHLVRVDDLLIDYVRNSSEFDDSDNDIDDDGNSGGAAGMFGVESVVTSNRIIKSRPKLKGSGVPPISPRIVRVAAAVRSPMSSSADSVLPRPVARTYHLATSGCQMNVADSERIAGVLELDLGLKPLPPGSSPLTADVVVLNTCTIRDHAESKVYDALGPHAARKRRGEAVAVVVAGCVAQQEGEKLLRRVPEIDLVMGPQYVGRIGDLLEGVGRGHQICATDPTIISEDLSRPVRDHPVRAWVNIIHGCNEHCTYCVVPGVRGVEQSRSMEAILGECVELAQGGYKEVTLLGQNIDAYGRDAVPRRTFADLLTFLNDNIPPGTIERIRYVTSHPRYFSDRVIDAVAGLDKVCECFHMPFQAGDDEVLRGMRRGYTYDSYMNIIHKIRARSPDASICGDVIVGFPGEDDAAFQRTLDLMEEVKFDNLNTFAYSPRPNTEAALRDDQVPEEVKSERLQIVQRLATKHALERSERYAGRKDVEVLVEDRNPRNGEQVMGRTRQGRQVFFDGDIDNLMGRTVQVEIIEARPWSLVGG